MKTKWTSSVPTLIMLVALFPFHHSMTAVAETYPFLYTVSDNGVTIVGTNIKGIDSIPEEIEQQPVTILSQRAFFACINSTKSIEIPATVTDIKDECFMGVIGSGYVDYIIPRSVESIGKYALGYTCYENYQEGDIIQDKIEKLHGVKIYGYIDTAAETYANKNGFTFIALDDEDIKGDINSDGVFNISDIVVLQKWLLNVPNTELANWKAADFCEDNELNAFDLCLMKKALIEKFETNPVVDNED